MRSVSPKQEEVQPRASMPEHHCIWEVFQGDICRILKLGLTIRMKFGMHVGEYELPDPNIVVLMSISRLLQSGPPGVVGVQRS